MFSSIPSVYSSIQLTVTSDQDLILNLILIKYSWKVECSWYPHPRNLGLFASWSNHGKSCAFSKMFSNFLGLGQVHQVPQMTKIIIYHHQREGHPGVFHIYHPIYHHLSPFIIIYHHKSTINHPQLSTINHLPRKDILGFLALGRPVFAAWGRSGNSSEWRRDSAEWRGCAAAQIISSC